MKSFKLTTLLVLFITAFLFTGCFNDGGEEKQIIEVTNTSEFDFKKELVGVESELNDLLSLIPDNSNGKMVIGSLKNGNFEFNDAATKKAIALIFKRDLLKQGYLMDFNTFDLLEDRIGKGLLRSKGECSISYESVYHAIDLDLELNREEDGGTVVIIGGGSTLTCTGCRRGCSPRRESNGDGYCTDCKITNSSCKKTEEL